MDITEWNKERSSMCPFAFSKGKGEFHTLDVCKITGKNCSNILK
jgi:hypothetical protein